MKTFNIIGILVLSILIYYVMAYAGQIQGDYGQQHQSSGSQDSSEWIDLYDYGFPDKVTFQLDLLMCDNTSAGSLYVWVEGSNLSSESDRNATGGSAHIATFYEGIDPTDTAFVGSADYGSYFLNIPPSVHYFAQDSLSHSNPGALTRYLRIISDASFGDSTYSWSKRYSVNIPVQ